MGDQAYAEAVTRCCDSRDQINRNLSRAEASFHSALEVYTSAADPMDWAATQNDLGVTLCNHALHSFGKDARTLRQSALQAFASGAEALSEKDQPQLWSMLQANLHTLLSV